MKLLFIDSNIFLNFYDFYEEDLNQLNKLVDLIKTKKIKLFLTKQVYEEFKKNREQTLNKAYKEFIKTDWHLNMPIFCKHYEEYGDIVRSQKIAKQLKSNLSKKLWDDILNQQLKADLLIKNILKVSTIIDSDKYLEKAIIRFRLGWPPGKKNRSVGDELNWESLLAEIPEEGEFIIISADDDYASPLADNLIKDFLSDEWNKNKSTKIFFYKSLGVFFKEHDIKIELLVEQEKDKLVGELRNSPNFSYTHNVIGILSQYKTFTNDQIRGFGTALMCNDQVRAIIDDEDVKGFYTSNLLDRPEVFKPNDWCIIKSLILGSENDREIEEEIIGLESKLDNNSEETENDEDIPF